MKYYIYSSANPDYTYNPDDQRWIDTAKNNIAPYLLDKPDAERIITNLPEEEQGYASIAEYDSN